MKVENFGQMFDFDWKVRVNFANFQKNPEYSFAKYSPIQITYTTISLSLSIDLALVIEICYADMKYLGGDRERLSSELLILC